MALTPKEPLTLADALAKLKSKPDGKLFFFFCEKAEDGKPRVIADTRKIDPKNHKGAQALMATAKAKGMSRGAMQMVNGALNLTPTKGGVARSKLQTGVKIAAGNEGVLSKIQGIHVGVEEDDEPDELPRQPQAAPMPPASIGQGGVRGLPSGYVSEDDDVDEAAPAPTVAARVFNVLPEGYEPDSEDLNFEPAQNAYLTEDPDSGVAAAPQQPPRPPALTPERVRKLAEKPAVRHDHPLAKSHPELGKLHARKLEAAQRLKLLLNEQPIDVQAVALAKQELTKLALLLEEAEHKLNLNATGVIPKGIGAEYVGEDKMRGRWRPPVKPVRGNLSDDEYRKELDDWKNAWQSNTVVTEYLTPEQRKANELHADSDGRMYNARHELMKGPPSRDANQSEVLKVGYVMDADEKKLYAFQEGTKKRAQGQERRIHHSSMLAGADVTGAGEITFDKGRIVGISNASGHYKPRTSHLLQTIETLLKQGFLLDTTYVMLDPVTGEGKPLDGKAKELYEKTLKAQQRIEQRKAKLGELQRLVDERVRKVESLFDPEGNPPTGDNTELDKETNELKLLTGRLVELERELADEIERVGKARDLLGKLGAAPANKLDKVTVLNLDINDSMTGAQVRTNARSDKSDLSDFVRSGGGNAVQAGLKADMLQELLKETRETREKLDQEAEELAGRWAERVREQLEKLEKLENLLEADVDSPDRPALLREIERCKSRLQRPSPPTDDALITAMEGLSKLDELWQSKNGSPQDVLRTLTQASEDLGYGEENWGYSFTPKEAGGSGA